MRRSILLVFIGAIGLVLGGCQNHLHRTLVDASSIPDQTYNVTVYKKFLSNSYAVLFDIPDDGTEVFMKSTSLTEEIGKDSPRKYIDEFDDRIKFYKTLGIDDQDGTVRGYLMVSSVLDYWISPVDERIMVVIQRSPDYYYGLP